MRRQQRGKEKTHLGGQCCTGAPRRGIARGHVGDGGHDADARSGRARANRGLLSGCTLLRSAAEQQRARCSAGGAGAAQPRQQRAQRSEPVDCGALKRPEHLQDVSFPSVSAQLSGERCVQPPREEAAAERRRWRRRRRRQTALLDQRAAATAKGA